ncbi:tryptophan--tRNA ligase [Elizabethkingia meningoseptica]|uniref:tryptophan--tRNA ligase n=1 Tax=Elizabethkingia meningoseptica TaxID=238 RepID=UPI000332C5B5|nr:tryptophan--tRNA ligase [Elizabethkingia meningoseptica]AQX04166.1 tryptophan--tRNA ligase [Elizabethkingia meningoseptica]AQX46207.1 tryptophan--tRNA ligase [Elizabethkingia meningoseptica]EJK5330332.1 tryptophan--tRNA ligase [Elizabethkingia meningoseptica]EOR30721.1 tryptophanyl-tRNA ligase [Elizabethkingia meningoseptica ATCC 13253 = NBRC 12535]KUY18723.1 tryptophan--tRNA ligase [Elizabethkingia meningoseptica]
MRVLTGIQATGTPHLGNLLGAIIPAIELAKNPDNDSFFFIANLHTLTQIKDAAQLRQNTYEIAAAWLACGLDTEKTHFYRQSDIPETCELTWYLDCFFPFQRLTLAHSFKDKADRLQDVNAGLFNYPILMAADILLYDAEVVPVGKDQQQHLEITRDVAEKFNRQMGEVFVLPSAELQEDTKYVPGTDGHKMSKSRGNIINIFLSEKELKKQVMSIETDSKSLEEPKDPETDKVFAIYELVATSEQTEALREKYLAGNFGYGHAKTELFNLLVERFAKEREVFNYYMTHLDELEEKLQKGAEKTREIARNTLVKVRESLGY